MEDFSDTKIISTLTTIIEYLDKVKPLIDSHMVLFFTAQYWSTLVPKAIQNELECVGIEGFSTVLWNCGKLDSVHEPCTEAPFEFPNLVEFLCNARRMYLHSLSDLVLTYQQLKERLTVGAGEHRSLKSRECMSSKKTHEVEVMSEVTAMLACVSGASHVVDVGGGKGYLSSVLAMHHELPVLGIDFSPKNTSSAARHSHKFQKAWRGVGSGEQETRKDKRSGTVFKNVTATDSRYKLLTQFVSPDTKLTQLVQDHFPSVANCNVCVVGLHTCGDLASTCLRIFAADERLVVLCGVGCCYNLLGETGFPVSSHLQRMGFTLGRNARMLAAQAVDRIAVTQQLAVDSLFYRALLEVLLMEICDGETHWGHVGRLAAKCSNFHEYVCKAIAKLNIDVQVSGSQIEALYEQYLPYKDQLQAFFSLRVTLAPVVETVLLLDRLLYLHEQGFHKSCLVQLFDPVVSPRCYGIISLKS